MNKSCFLAPIHEAKFNYGLDWIKSYNEHFDDDHIYLVFSSEEERKKFADLAEGLKYRSIIYDGHTWNKHCIVTHKKWYGLIQIFSQTDFDKVGVIDVDSRFICNKNYDELFQNKINNGLVHANSGNREEFYTYALKYFKFEDYQFLKDYTSGNNVHWHDIIVYYKPWFLEMCDYLGFNQKDQGEDFMIFRNGDYAIYYYYLFLKKYAKLSILDVSFEGGSFIEKQRFMHPEKFARLFHSYNPMWIMYPIENMKNVFMLTHVDISGL